MGLGLGLGLGLGRRSAAATRGLRGRRSSAALAGYHPLLKGGRNDARPRPDWYKDGLN